MPKDIIEPIQASFNVLTKATTIAKPIAVVSAPLRILGTELQCAVLNDETRVLSATSIFAAFDRPRKGMNSRLAIGADQIPPFLASKNLVPFINQGVLGRTKLIKYLDNGIEKEGFTAELLVDMCEVYLSAKEAGVLTSRQERFADKADLLLRALARVGISALVDEATGYQRFRSNDALRLLLEKYVTEGMQEWIKTFPDSFFEQLDRLYGNEKTKSYSRPMYYGRFINTYIYNPIEHGYIKSELDKKNIDAATGKRKARFHQWLTEDGKHVLDRQIAKVEGRMEMFDDIQSFSKAEKKRKAVSIAPYLFDEMNKIIE